MARARSAQIASEAVPAELDVVGLLEAVQTENGLIPRGAEGTIVIVWESGAYGVEFDTPVQDVVNVRREQVTLVHRA